MDPEWQRQAAQAMEDRVAGKFDEWKEKNFEEYWGQKSKPPIVYQADVGEGKGSASIRLCQMVQGRMFQVGDILSYSRLFTNEPITPVVLIEKWVKVSLFRPGHLVYHANLSEVIAINFDTGFITFAIPRGTAKKLPTATGEQDNFLTYATASHIGLAEEILKTDGRISLPNMSSTWTDLQCHRGVQHLGSLWDLRDAYYRSMHPQG